MIRVLVNDDSAPESSMSTASEDATFVQFSRVLVGDFLEPDPRVYWVDLSVSPTIAYTATPIFVFAPFGELIAWICYFIAGAMLYRLSMFIHELVHFRRGEMSWFRTYWDFSVGIWLLIPTFIYISHLDHHSSRHYGTKQDGEYLPLGLGTVTGVAMFMAQVLIQPLLILFRFLILTPVSYFHPPLRRWVIESFSSLVINFRTPDLVGKCGDT